MKTPGPISRRDFVTAAVAAGPLARLLAARGIALRIGAPDWSLRQEVKLGAVELAHRIGFDGLEVSLGRGPGIEQLPMADPELQRQYLEESKKHGMPIVSTCLNILHRNYLKSDPLGDPMINDDHVRMLKLAAPRELTWIKRTALRINTVLVPYLRKKQLLLVDFKLEFGRAGKTLLLGDEISPDTCRLWDATTREKLDKDRFRRDLGGVEEAYQEVYRRVVPQQ